MEYLYANKTKTLTKMNLTTNEKIAFPKYKKKEKNNAINI